MCQSLPRLSNHQMKLPTLGDQILIPLLRSIRGGLDAGTGPLDGGLHLGKPLLGLLKDRALGALRLAGQAGEIAELSAGAVHVALHLRTSARHRERRSARWME